MRVADSELLGRAQRGDNAAFNELVDRYARGLFRLAFSLVGNVADAEDVVQETLLGVFRRSKSFEGRSSVKTWLFRVLIRQTARHHRSKGRRKTLSIDELTETRALPGSREEPGRLAREVNTRLDVGAALETLSPEHREVVVLREFEGMSYAEMAEVLAIPGGTVESRLFRARQELKKRLEGYLP